MARKKHAKGESANAKRDNSRAKKESAGAKKGNIAKRAVMAREEPSYDRSFVIVPEELRRLYPNVKVEYIQKALEKFGKHKFGDGESVIQAFGKVLAAVIIDETIGKRGGGE